MSYKITVNTYPYTSVDTVSWNLNSERLEPERISIRKGDKEFSLVFDDEVRLEIWSLDKNGELEELESTLYPANKGIAQYLEDYM